MTEVSSVPLRVPAASFYPLPPRKLPAPGSVVEASLLVSSPSPDSPGSYAARHVRGMKYERAVLAALAEQLSSFQATLLARPWFRYRLSGEERFRHCQPDGLILAQSGVYVLEIKLSPVSDAYWTLSRLYAPVVERALSVPAVFRVMVSRYPDPALAIPEDWVLADGLASLFSFPEDRLRFLPWKK